MRSTLLMLLFVASGCAIQPVVPRIKLMNLEQAAQRLSELAGKPVRPYSTRDFGRETYSEARSVVVPEGAARSLVRTLRDELSEGLVAFLGCTRSLADNPAEGTEIVVGLGESQFDILRIAASDAVNYDMETDDLVRKLQHYDADFGIDIFHAETDTIEFDLKSMPGDLRAFCDDLYEFCPDVVDQGAGSIEALEKEISQRRAVFLWWD